MARAKGWAATISLIGLLGTSVAAVEPHEVLDDPALEARARALSQDLRCPVCRNENIDESDAGISADLRVTLRERLVAGDTDAEAVQFLVDRYGTFILLNPRAEGVNLVLWLSAPVMVLIAASLAVVTIRSRAKAAPPETLSAAEKKRLDDILKS